jgi:flavodoxin
MRKMKWMLAIVAAMFSTTCFGAGKDGQKVLVLFYSQTSNTRNVAQAIASRLGADLEEIVPVKPYDGDFQATISRSSEERGKGITPDIKPLTADLSKYDVIFLGYPIWFGTYAPPIATFLNQVDLSGKKIVPFCTFGSGGLDSSVNELATKQPGAILLPGYGVRAARMAAVPKEVDEFLMAGGFLEGDYTPLADFADEHEVSAEETAIFDKAVGSYPMIHATAKTVASRTVPGGMEYVFKAVDQPRGNGQQMPPAGEMKIYVLALQGQAPEFTQVVRSNF